MKKTIAEKLRTKKYKRPNKFLYNLLLTFVVKALAKKYKTKFIRNIDIKKYNGKQFILVGNHASRADYIFATLAVGGKNPLNFVVGHNEFYRSHLKLIFNIANAIPKKNFVPDMTTLRGISSIIKAGGNICIFPEGMSSISGAQQPVALGSGKLIKHYKLPVLMIKIKGGYLTNTKFCLTDRPGKVEVELSELLTVDQINKLSTDEIDKILNSELYHDDYEWNAEKQIAYNCGAKPEYHIEQLLYKCPNCLREHKIKGENGKIKCSACGFEVSIDEKYNLTAEPGSKIPASPSKWIDWERRMARKEVLDPNFVLKEKVNIGVLPNYKYLSDAKTSQFVGTGFLSLNKEGLTFEGKKDGEPFNFFIESKNLPTYGMCTDASVFYTFAHNGTYYEFTPLESKTAMKWLLCTEEIHRINGGKWQNYHWFDYDDENSGFIIT